VQLLVGQAGVEHSDLLESWTGAVEALTGSWTAVMPLGWSRGARRTGGGIHDGSLGCTSARSWSASVHGEPGSADREALCEDARAPVGERLLFMGDRDGTGRVFRSMTR
jgi:hypothetical protein